jgi:hypothetical protein
VYVPVSHTEDIAWTGVALGTLIFDSRDQSAARDKRIGVPKVEVSLADANRSPLPSELQDTIHNFIMKHESAPSYSEVMIVS